MSGYVLAGARALREFESVRFALAESSVWLASLGG
jgi:hypothetical protein